MSVSLVGKKATGFWGDNLRFRELWRRSRAGKVKVRLGRRGAYHCDRKSEK